MIESRQKWIIVQKYNCKVKNTFQQLFPEQTIWCACSCRASISQSLVSQKSVKNYFHSDDWVHFALICENEKIFCEYGKQLCNPINRLGLLFPKRLFCPSTSLLYFQTMETSRDVTPRSGCEIIYGYEARTLKWILKGLRKILRIPSTESETS